MIDSNQMFMVEKICEDVRREFPIIEHPTNFRDEVHNLIAGRVQEKVNFIEQKYKKEFAEYEKDFANAR